MCKPLKPLRSRASSSKPGRFPGLGRDNWAHVRMAKNTPDVAIIMGSQSDWATMKAAADMLDRLGVPYDARIISAHRTPDRLYAFAKSAAEDGFKVIIAGAGGAAHLPGMVASLTLLPVLGVPVRTKSLNGLDSLYSIVQMPKGVAVGTLAIGEAGAANAGLLAAQILALTNAELGDRLAVFREKQTAQIADIPKNAHEDT